MVTQLRATKGSWRRASPPFWGFQCKNGGGLVVTGRQEGGMLISGLVPAGSDPCVSSQVTAGL